MNEVQIRDILINYLQTLPSIKSCEISLRSYGFYLMTINNTSLVISDNMNDPKGRPLGQEGLLIEADIKQELAFEIALKLRELYTLYDNPYYKIFGHKVENFKTNYIREEK